MKKMNSNWKMTCKDIAIALIKMTLLFIAMLAIVAFVVAWSAPMD